MSNSTSVDESIDQKLRDLWDRLEKLDPAFSNLPSLQMVQFITQVIGKSPLKILDPCTKNGALLVAINKMVASTLSVGIIDNHSLESILSQQFPKIDWHFENCLDELESVKKQGIQFDIAISYPGYELDSYQDLKDDYHKLISQSCNLVYDSGKAFFILPNSFFAPGFPKIKDSFAKQGLHIWSVVSLPSRWSPNGQPIDLIELRKYPTDKLFVAKASPDSSNLSLITNLAQRSETKVVEFGSLIDPNSFFTWDGYAVEIAFLNSAKSMGAKVIKLSDIISEIYLVDEASETGFSARPNSIFLPIEGTSQASSIIPNNGDAKGYIQLVFDPTLANSKYMTKYFDTHLGRLSRLILQRGNALSEISTDVVQRTPIGIHNLDQQNEIITYQQRIEELSAMLQIAQHDLWDRKKGVRTIEPILALFPNTNDLNTWIPRLPYPLASILWLHEATLDTRRKSEILFAFFEATAEFITTILLSGLRSNRAIYDQLVVKELAGVQSKLWETTTFGFWVTNGKALASTIRQKLQDPTQRLIYLNLFKCSGNWLELLANKELFQILDRITQLRNNWKGHGGVESDRENKEHYRHLRQELINLFTPLSHAFEQVMLLAPKSMQCEDGQVFKVLVDKLSGANIPFQETTLQLRSLVNTNSNLYLIETHASQALELLPFVKIEYNSPEIACYFYSQLKPKSVRFISYHQASQSEIQLIDPKVTSLIGELSK